MGLRDQLQQDLQNAMRARDEHRKAALRMVLLEVQLAEAERGALSDADVLALIQKEIKRRTEALDMFRQGGRADLEANELVELEILKGYLPAALSPEALTGLARAAIAEVGATSIADMGKVMQVLMPRVRGQADGRLVNQIVRDLLSA
ncbi:MAG TPA: GatB/YqeY domain-containing protein [Anaerolineae bacterium]|nr:GatB/YqeY domain-containing protein [Anaerolineae bacterium]HOV47746.1 GatB/YqeY domain-containing protein [Anaerolineae bacterium]HPD40970.1 GatB/YqeY domain-containing protein [Anaerolineae bacterium]HRU93834.1 GatB/YqeY domain-containing protein [Anaerolineae bacterium]HUM36580.1 GatB/YqeY domain-containing protein [Anaerolineae bacterium]